MLTALRADRGAESPATRLAFPAAPPRLAAFGPHRRMCATSDARVRKALPRTLPPSRRPRKIRSGFSRDYIFRGARPNARQVRRQKSKEEEVFDTAYRDAHRRLCFSAPSPPAAHRSTAVCSAVWSGGGHLVGLRRRAQRPDGWGAGCLVFRALASLRRCPAPLQSRCRGDCRVSCAIGHVRLASLSRRVR